MSRHSGENTLLQLIRNIKDAYDHLKTLVNAKQQPYIVTADLDMSGSGSLNNVSRTMDEILEAHKRGDHVLLQLDISSLMPGLTAQVALTTVSEDEASFILNTYMGVPYLFAMGLRADGSSYVLMIPLAEASS